MQGFPHRYQTTASATASSHVAISSAGLPTLNSTPPPEFGGPEGNWSPETLLVASVADCFILTFKAIAGASKLDWQELTCDANGTLDRVGGVMKFTRMDLAVTLTVPAGTDQAKADKLLHKAEQVCLVTNSLSAECHLETSISEA
ncbi:MAG: OsmC family protein [Pseudomonadota bacterium]